MELEAEVPAHAGPGDTPGGTKRRGRNFRGIYLRTSKKRKRRIRVTMMPSCPPSRRTRPITLDPAARSPCGRHATIAGSAKSRAVSKRNLGCWSREF